MIVAFFSFHPDSYQFVGKDHTPRKGSWKVIQCVRACYYDDVEDKSIRVVDFYVDDRHGGDPVKIKALRMPVERPLLRGSFANPKRLAMEYLYPLHIIRGGLRVEDRIHA